MKKSALQFRLIEIYERLGANIRTGFPNIQLNLTSARRRAKVFLPSGINALGK
jgi:hypothetical protein